MSRIWLRILLTASSNVLDTVGTLLGNVLLGQCQVSFSVCNDANVVDRLRKCWLRLLSLVSRSLRPRPQPPQHVLLCQL